MHAEQVTAAVDQLLGDPAARPPRLDPATDGLLDTAHHLAQLPSLLGPVDPALEQQVMRRVRAGSAPARRRPLRLGWAAAALAAILLAGAMLFTPLGQTAVASFMAVFQLGRTEVRITPVDTPSVLRATAVAGGAAVQQHATLEEAQSQVSFPIPQPAGLPPGYALRAVNSYTYPDLPAWIPQPFFVELVYDDDAGHECSLRIYPISLGDDATISGMNLEATPIRAVQDVDINSQPGVLLQLGTAGDKSGWQEVVWEQGDLILALYSTNLTEADLLRAARSVR
jgi:hypothetical protein